MPFGTKRNAAASIFLVALAGVLVAAPASEGTAPPEPAGGSQEIGRSFDAPPGALVAPGKAPDLTLLFTGDVLGFVDPCG